MQADRRRAVTPRTTAGVLLVISGVTHVAQLAVYPAEGHVLGAAAFGAAYLAIGLLVLRGSRAAVWLGATVPAVGGAAGAYRFLHLHRNPFSVFHILVDLVVVPACVWSLACRGRRADDGTGNRIHLPPENRG